MTNAKHTPGPWGISDDGDWLQQNGGKSPLVDGRYFSICVTATSEADRHLIASSPDLLDVAKRLASLERDDNGRAFPSKEDIAAARAAIAKAEGRE